MHILVLSFYYRPDLSAGSFRTTALVRELHSALPADAKIDVITTLPNRYQSFVTECAEVEQADGIEVRRIALPAHKSDMVGQARAFWRFAREVRRLTAGRRYDLVYATSSRLMTATLGAVVARHTDAKLYLDIRDIFVDTIKDVIASPWSYLLRPVLATIERWTMRRANHINLVSGGFQDYFVTRYPTAEYSQFTNGVDEEFVAAGPAQDGRAPSGLIKVLYAGNIGEGQGLHSILPQLALQMRSRLRFKVIGDGGRRIALVNALAAVGALDLVEIVPPVTRDKLIEAYGAADVLFVHLNDMPAFEKVLPSKVFEYAALGKPIWAGVAGYSAAFIASEIENAAVFRPCDVLDAEKAFARLDLAAIERGKFKTKYLRRTIMQSMARSILSYLP